MIILTPLFLGGFPLVSFLLRLFGRLLRGRGLFGRRGVELSAIVGSHEVIERLLEAARSSLVHVARMISHGFEDLLVGLSSEASSDDAGDDGRAMHPACTMEEDVPPERLAWLGEVKSMISRLPFH